MTTRTCPGLCGRQIPSGATFGCVPCDRRLPPALRTRLYTTRWARDWHAHSGAITTALHWVASHRPPPTREP